MRIFQRLLAVGLTVALLYLVGEARLGQAAPTQKTPVKSGNSASKVNLKLVMPRAIIDGTPRIIIGTNADRSELTKKLPPFHAPPGSTNVALHKPVTSSDARPIIGTLSLLTDGDKEATDGSWMTLAPGKQWIQVDLKKDCEIYDIALWHYHGETRAYHDVVVQIATDADFTENVYTVFNADQHNQLGLGPGQDRDYFESSRGKIIDVKSITGRYVRCYSKGNTSDDENNYTEIEVYGKAPQTEPTSNHAGKVELKLKLPKPPFTSLMRPLPLDTTLDRSSYKHRGPFYVPPGVMNVALHKPVTSSDDRPIIGATSLLTDGDKEATDASWVTYAPGKQWVQIDLKKDYNLYAIVVWHYFGEARVYRDVIVQVSDDTHFIKDGHTVFNNDARNELGLGVGTDREYFETYQGKLIDAKGIKGRYVRLYSKGNNSDDENNYTEVEVYGK